MYAAAHSAAETAPLFAAWLAGSFAALVALRRYVRRVG